jgi:hypothetical protein
MKNLLIIATLTVLGFSSCSKADNSSTPATVVAPITEQEKTDLIFLREEEKFAHDVYVYAYAKYGHMVFSHISSSEQTHANAVLDLLNAYGIANPAANNPEGVFTDPTLQALYTQMIAKVDSSLNDALYVGATIEDLDISDIKRLNAHTTKTDLLQVYANLTCGSRNHIRSFISQLGTYKPQYITQAELDSIIATGHEGCGN